MTLARSEKVLPLHKMGDTRMYILLKRASFDYENNARFGFDKLLGPLE